MTVTKAMDRVCDALDIETFIICKDEDEGKELAFKLGHELNLGKIDIVFLEYRGIGARVRLRAYLHRPGDHYLWLDKED